MREIAIPVEHTIPDDSPNGAHAYGRLTIHYTNAVNLSHARRQPEKFYYRLSHDDEFGIQRYAMLIERLLRAANTLWIFDLTDQGGENFVHEHVRTFLDAHFRYRDSVYDSDETLSSISRFIAFTNDFTYMYINGLAGECYFRPVISVGVDEVCGLLQACSFHGIYYGLEDEADEAIPAIRQHIRAHMKEDALICLSWPFIELNAPVERMATLIECARRFRLER